MKWMDNLIDKWNGFWDRFTPFFDGVGKVFRAIRRTFRNFGKYLFWFRSVVVGAPMLAAAIIIAAMNLQRLPETVSYTKITLDPEATNALFGLFVMSQDAVSRNLAAMIPVALTALCVVLMIFTKRMLFPFFVGLLTLLLPQAIYYLTIFPM